MNAKTRFDRQVSASNARLTDISPKAVDWAYRNLVQHWAFRTPSGDTACGECGHKFHHKGKGSFVKCPECGRRLKIKDTLKRKIEESTYFSTLEAIDGLQVQRVSLLSVTYKKGMPKSLASVEICRLWLNAKGQTALTSKNRTLGHYLDSFNWASPIELKSGISETHFIISNTYIYPRLTLIPELRRNGMTNDCNTIKCHPFRLMKSLLADSRIETMMKAGHFGAVDYFVNNPSRLDQCWNSYKIASRHGYVPADWGIWCDLIRLLDRCGRDIRSTRYICPTDLKAEHDKWLDKTTTAEEKRKDREQLIRAKAKEEDFLKSKSCYFGIVISDKDIEVSVLDSIEAYQAEGTAMHHCVFKCEYYAQKDSIVLSAHDKSGNRIETVEFSLTENRVVQSRGRCNTNTEYHDRIVNLVNANAHRFIEAKASA